MASESVSVERFVGKTSRFFRVKVSDGISKLSFDVHDDGMKSFMTFLEQETPNAWIEGPTTELEFLLTNRKNKLSIVLRNRNALHAASMTMNFEQFVEALKRNEEFLAEFTAAREKLHAERDELAGKTLSKAIKKFDEIVWEDESEAVVANRFSFVFRGRKTKREMIDELKRWKTVCFENDFSLCFAHVMDYW